VGSLVGSAVVLPLLSAAPVPAGLTEDVGWASHGRVCH
jgi:hypothetical protein